MRKRLNPLPPLDRVFRGVRLAVSAGVRTPAERTKRDQMLTYLRDTDRFDLWCALADGRLSVPEVYVAYRDGKLHLLTGDLSLHRSLVDAVEAWLPVCAPAQSTRDRYAVTWKHFRRVAVPLVDGRTLAPDAKVRALELVDWPALKAGWVGGPHDWKHLRGLLSRFLTVILSPPTEPEEGQFHPFRRRIMKRIPPAPKTHRVPDLTPAAFWQIVAALPEPLQAVPVALALTGMRIGELCACTDANLLPLTHQVRIPGHTVQTSEFKSDDTTQPVDPRLWAWVARAIPVPLKQNTIQGHWQDARKRAGIPQQITLHDLRHCHGQWLVNAGRSEESVQRSLRHKTPNQTRNYTMQKERQENARVIADILIESHGNPQTRKRQGGRKRA